MLVTLFFAGLVLSVQGLPAHLPGHVHDHVIPAHHVSPVTHARLVSETVESRNDAQEIPATESVSIPAEADDGFSASVDSSVVSESPAPATEVTEVRNEVLPAPQVPVPVMPSQEVVQEVPSQQIVQSEHLPMEQQQMIVQHGVRDVILPLMSNFPCEGHSRGYFADEMTDCKIFVQCNPNMDPHGYPFMERFVFQCPVETRWDQRLLTCVRTEDALPCPSSRLYWADTEMRFAQFADLPMQTIVPIPDGAIKGAPIVQSQFVEQLPAPMLESQVIEPMPQVVEQAPIKTMQVIEQLPKVSQIVEQAPIKSAQVIEPMPQVIEQAPIKSAQIVEQLPAVTRVIEKTNFPTKTVIRNDFPTKTVIRNDFGTKTVQKSVVLPTPMAVKTFQRTSFPTKTVQRVVSSFPTKTVQRTFGTKSAPLLTRTVQTIAQPSFITRTVSQPMMTRTFFRSPIQHFRAIPGAFVSRIA